MDEKLIESVKKFPCLWDTRLTTYKCNETKDAAWEIIVKETGFQDAKAAKAKWKKLRDSHRDAIKRQNSVRSGQAAKQICQWKYQKFMEFLLPHMNNRNRSSNFRNYSELVNSPIYDNSRMSATLNTTDESELTQLDALLSSQQFNPIIDDSTNSTSPSVVLTSVPSTSSTTRKRKPEEICALLKQHQDNHKERMEERAALKKILTAPDDFDDLDHFFLAISKSLKKLPIYLRLKVKRTCINCLLEAEEENTWAAPDYYSSSPTETYTSGREQSIPAGSSSTPPPPGTATDKEEN